VAGGSSYGLYKSRPVAATCGSNRRFNSLLLGPLQRHRRYGATHGLIRGKTIYIYIHIYIYIYVCLVKCG